LTTCSNEVTVGTTGPIGSGLPQFGLPRRLAIDSLSSRGDEQQFCKYNFIASGFVLLTIRSSGMRQSSHFKDFFSKNQ
jgi:hypothetical protein